MLLVFSRLFFYWKTVVHLWPSHLSTSQIGGLADEWIAPEGAQRKRWLAASLIINLSVLLYFKYAYFIADALQPLLGAH